jgi:exopolyphosphatase / guanosine-5'-triphosphate,3'-diphosphate pyrophosphatase
MTIVTVGIDHDVVTVAIDDDDLIELPVGIRVLRSRELHADPPRPEELTNAIGAVFDHVDDIVRVSPHVLHARVEVRGAAVNAIVAVEVGGEPVLPFLLSRDAAEDVFRTVATEPAADRRLNPGLRPSMVDDIVPAACALVAVMRRLHLDHVEVVR